ASDARVFSSRNTLREARRRAPEARLAGHSQVLRAAVVQFFPQAFYQSLLSLLLLSSSLFIKRFIDDSI
ncbi:MAG: hypothetical protein ACTSX6_12785, partial [Candidatus Heimdallarchaeaceae archaeon]